MAYRLYEFSVSPFCIKIRAILAYKGISYERVDAARPATMRELRRRGGIGKAPAFDFDGSFVCDSTEIAYELEKRHPSPSLIPQDPRDRALCHVLEDWADESLYWFGVYYRWIDPAGKSSAGSMFPHGFFGQHVIPRIVHSTAKGQIRGQGLSRKSPEQVRHDLERQLDRLDDLLKTGSFLLGDTPSLADFAVHAQLVYLHRSPGGEIAIDKHQPILQFMSKMKPWTAT